MRVARRILSTRPRGYAPNLSDVFLCRGHARSADFERKAKEWQAQGAGGEGGIPRSGAVNNSINLDRFTD